MRIVLQFVGSDDLGSAIIEYKGGGPYSHVDLVIDDGHLLGARSDEIGGAPAGVQIRPADYEQWAHIARITIDANEFQAAAFWAFAKEQIGKPYDETAIAAFIFGRNWRNPDSWFCSELGAACLESAGVFSHPVAAPVNKIDPSGLFMLASTIGSVQVIK
jgi:hypothetical protein